MSVSKPVAEAINFKICFSGTADRETTRAATIPAGKDYQATGRVGLTGTDLKS